MLRIGLVDLDTSHPAAFTRLLNEMPGVRVTALWDGHDVWPPGYDARFGAEHGVPVVCERLDEMVGRVDAAMLHGVNWERRVERARPFLEAGLPVLLDKPLAGSVADVRALLALDDRFPGLLFGGSALRYAPEVERLRAEAAQAGGTLTAVASGPGDFFSYGIHTTEMAQGVLGAGVREVTDLGGERPGLFLARYADGRRLIVQLEQPFYEWSLCLYTAAGLRSAKVDPDGLYPPFLRRFVRFARGDREGFSLADALEPVLLHLAAHHARASGRPVALAALPADARFDGAAFAAEYAAARRAAGG